MGRGLCKIVCLYSLLIASSAIYIDEDCLVRQKYESNQDGTQTHIRAWVNGTDQSSLIVRITLEFDPEGIPETFDIIEIWRNQIEIRRVRENTHRTPQNITFDQTLALGWMEMIVISGDKFSFNFPKIQNMSYSSAGEKERLRKITIEGSYITINCEKDDIYWKIEDKEKKIPLELNSYTEFSTFSRKEYIPSFKIGEKYLQLGFKDGVMGDVSSIKDKLQVPLSDHKEYHFRIGCMNKICNMKLGENGEGQKISVNFSSTMRISGRGGDSFILILHLKKINTQVTLATEPPPTGNSAIIALSIVLVLVSIVLLLIIVIILWRYNKQKRQLGCTTLSNKNEEEQELMMKPTLSHKSSISSSMQMGIRLWDAVVQNDIEHVRYLLEQGINPDTKEASTPTSPLQEAHLLGNKKITTMFKKHLKINTSTASEELITFTLKTLKSRMSEVFSAAKYGHYERNGVSLLLKSHSLPGTIRDDHGRSLVHYFASARFSDGRPAWEPSDIENFFKEQKYYINAIDHWGNTALHSLATQKCNEMVLWNGKQLAAKETWIEMAKLLVENGCNRRIANHQNLLPHEIATNSGNHEMAQYLKEESDSYSEIDHKKLTDHYEDLLKAVKEKDTTSITKLLMDRAPISHLFAKEFLLAEALRSSHAETVFLLLCAGVPLCNCSKDDLTSLEVAHHTIGLPALFPALMRKVYADRLKDEIKKITSNDDIHLKLKKALEIMRDDIIIQGRNCKWKFGSNDKKSQNIEAKKLLCVASSLGLSLAVKLLGLEDVELHPLPGEENPVNNAQCGQHIDTLYALFRDLKLAPYTTAKQEMMPGKLKLEFLISESELLKKAFLNEVNQLLLGLDKKGLNTYLEEFKILNSSTSKEASIDSKKLFLLSRCGLVNILHQLSQTKTIDLDQVILPFSNCTMMHISSHYGHLHFTEYLLYHGANPSLKSKGNFTAAHIAGITGQGETMNYVLDYMKYLNLDVEECCDLGTTAEVMFEQNSNMYQSYNFQKMKADDAFLVRNEVRTEDKTYQILKKKGQNLSIKDKVDLVKAVKAIQLDHHSLNENQLEEVVSELYVLKNDLDGSDFEGILKGHDQFYEENKAFSDDEVRFILELNAFTEMKDGKNISLTQSQKDIMVYSIEGEKKKKLFKENNFMIKYTEKCKEIIQNYKPASSKLCLAPPFLIPYKKGVILFWIWHSENKCRQVRSFIEPVIKADWPSKESLKDLPEDKLNICTPENYIHLHPYNINGKWTLRAYDLMREIFRTLSDDERDVWLICRLLILLIKKQWWAPSLNGRKFEDVGVQALPERALRTLFLKELIRTPRSKWSKEDAYERVCSIFCHIVEKDEDGKSKVIEELRPVTLPHTPQKINYPCVLGIIRYLKEFAPERPEIFKGEEL